MGTRNHLSYFKCSPTGEATQQPSRRELEPPVSCPERTGQDAFSRPSYRLRPLKGGTQPAAESQALQDEGR